RVLFSIKKSGEDRKRGGALLASGKQAGPAVLGNKGSACEYRGPFPANVREDAEIGLPRFRRHRTPYVAALVIKKLDMRIFSKK
ncbi:hypothetical protein, partial [Acinetobacter baumannii]|uniref:hypothetical protein n=1 Tax=Acinetobacter baumannii TaxID=470 RepID=UPI001969F2EE